MPTVSVYGRAESHMPPERGTLLIRLHIKSDEPDFPRPAVDLAYSTVSQLAAAATSSGVATWWSASAIATWSREEWLKHDYDAGGEYVTRYYASAEIKVKFQDFKALQQFVDNLPTFDGVVSVIGVDWALTEITKKKITAQVRAKAVQDAYDRAKLYAEAARFTSVELKHLSERLDGGYYGDESVAMSTRRGKSSDESPAVDLRPEDITVSATVTAEYRLRFPIPS